jgi:hypothetical protein
MLAIIAPNRDSASDLPSPLRADPAQRFRFSRGGRMIALASWPAPIDWSTRNVSSNRLLTPVQGAAAGRAWGTPGPRGPGADSRECCGGGRLVAGEFYVADAGFLKVARGPFSP